MYQRAYQTPRNSCFKGTSVFYWILSRWTLNFISILLWLPLFWTRSLQSIQHNFNYNILKVLLMCYSLVTSLTFLSPSCTFCCNQVRIPPNVFVERMCTLIVLYFLLWGRGQRESCIQSRDENENSKSCHLSLNSGLNGLTILHAISGRLTILNAGPGPNILLDVLPFWNDPVMFFGQVYKVDDLVAPLFEKC